MSKPFYNFFLFILLFLLIPPTGIGAPYHKLMPRKTPFGKAAYSQKKEEDLSKKAKAWLKVMADPDITCFLDEIALEQEKVKENIELKPGKYRLKFVKPGQPPIEQIIFAEAGRVTVVSVDKTLRKEREKKRRGRNY
ncbi:MAG: hypothetical protein HY391_04330 [Deltaproteobacteria bacterium]|nr:hypothetical protein [Deltaproteobacteria bacterium]